MKLTRRKWAAVVSATASSLAAAQASPQTSAPADELQAARDRIKTTGDLLARQTVPMATEPAFQFKA